MLISLREKGSRPPGGRDLWAGAGEARCAISCAPRTLAAFFSLLHWRTPPDACRRLQTPADACGRHGGPCKLAAARPSTGRLIRLVSAARRRPNRYKRQQPMEAPDRAATWQRCEAMREISQSSIHWPFPRCDLDWFPAIVALDLFHLFQINSGIGWQEEEEEEEEEEEVGEDR